MAEWFEVRDLGDGYVLIAEPGHVNSYLVIGSDRALLFDTGMGIAPISDAVRTLTDRPLVVVASHDHGDHRGGHPDLVAAASTGRIELAEIAGHPAGRCDAVDPAFLALYAVAVGPVVEAHTAYRELDDELFFGAVDLPRMRPLPDLTRWSVPGVPVPRRLEDGAEIDLGDRRLRVLHTPGHATDALALWEEARGTLLTGDTVLTAAHWLHQGGDVAAFASSVRRLAELGSRRALVAHNLRYEVPGSYVDRVSHAAQRLAAGDSRPRRARDLLGRECRRHDVEGVTFLTDAS